jgi:pimeloyl-ACP methyl ester carboxylesterase
MTPTLTEGRSPVQWYDWQGYRCAYDCQGMATAPFPANSQSPAIVTIAPVGVGLSRLFWQRFCQHWAELSSPLAQCTVIYNPDLLGCGDSAKPRYALDPRDWARQLQHFVDTVVQRPVMVVVQGGSVPVAIELAGMLPRDRLVGLVLSGPPAWSVITEVSPPWQRRVLWNLLDSPLGYAFYRYARREAFLTSFSVKQLFATAEQVDREWLATLRAGSVDLATRHAVFAFLARLWQLGYGPALAAIEQPVLALFGETASSISRSGKGETPAQRMALYEQHLQRGRSRLLPGRNVMPYEAPAPFTQAVLDFAQEIMV